MIAPNWFHWRCYGFISFFFDIKFELQIEATKTEENLGYFTVILYTKEFLIPQKIQKIFFSQLLWKNQES